MCQFLNWHLIAIDDRKKLKNSIVKAIRYILGILLLWSGHEKLLHSWLHYHPTEHLSNSFACILQAAFM
jgi:hypothetical protein